MSEEEKTQEKDLRLKATGKILEMFDQLQDKIGTASIQETLRVIITNAHEYEFDIKPKLIKKALDDR